MTGDARLKQVPDMDPPESEIVFRVVDRATLKRIETHIIVPDDVDGTIILRDGTGGAEIGRRAAADAREAQPWKIPLLANSRYELECEGDEFGTTFDPGKSGVEPYVLRFRR